MAKVLYSATMSVDGFITGPDGDMSWLAEHLGSNPLADLLVSRIGALLVGNRTFHGDDPNRGTDQEGAFGGEWSGPQFVVTHHLPDRPTDGVFFHDDLADALEAAKDAAGDKYVNVLGADIARQCFAAGEVDEVLVFVAPVLLGDGTRLFGHSGGQTIRLSNLIEAQTANATGIWYRVVQ